MQNNGETPVLQLTNLHGDIIATAYLSETATALASTADTSEFGVPTTSLPPKYSWLGGLELPAELPSGIISMGARSYVPQLGRFLQPDPRPGGSANAYSYTFGDPVNSSDPSGESSLGPAWAVSAEEQRAGETAAPWLAEQAAIHAAEESEAQFLAGLTAQNARYEAEQAAGPQYWGEEEWWEEYEEEEYEYASYHQGEKSVNQEGHIELAVLVQPLNGEEAGGSKGANTIGSTVPFCKVGSEGPCARAVAYCSRETGLCHGGGRGLHWQGSAERLPPCANFNPEPRCQAVYLGRAKAEYSQDNSVSGMYDRAGEAYDGYGCLTGDCQSAGQDLSEG